MVKIITDTLSCLSHNVAARYQIPIIPQVINFGNDSYLEGIDLDINGFMEKLKNSKELPKTAAPPPELFIKEFQRLVPEGEPILCIHPSAEVSGTVRSAQVAAEEFPQADIRVIDTRLVASPLGTVVQIAAEMAEVKVKVDKIEEHIHAMTPRCRIYFLIATLDYLIRGGRIGGATGLIGNVLQIKPILTFRDGRVDQFEKERTHKRALARLKELVLEQIPRDGNGYLSVLHAGVPEQGQELADDLRTLLGLTDVPIYHLPPAIVTHGGPGILGVGFFVCP
jgi:DegV family protein with EDD domain